MAMQRMRKVLVSAALVAAGVGFMATPASAAEFTCDVAGLAMATVDIPIAASGPAAVVVGETNRYNIDLDLGGVIPPEFSALSGNATKAVASLNLPASAEVDPATATVTGAEGATVAVSGDQAVVTIPGPIPFGGDATLPALTVSIDVKATQAGEIVLTTEGATAVLEAEAKLTPEADPIPITATCASGEPTTLLTVSATDVAGATQTAAPNVQTSSATATATPATASPAAMATTGAESITLSGVALILMGFGMLAVAGQRVLAYRRI
jgi:dehydratase